MGSENGSLRDQPRPSSIDVFRVCPPQISGRGQVKVGQLIEGETLNDIVREARLRLLRMHYESGVGHIGGNLSCLDVLLTLHHRVLRDEDRFVLSKGHAAGALYVTLWSRGLLTDDDLKQFHKEGTKLAGHPP